ncbi:VOC family protein [Microscilla marina]|uniref:VOC family protein n=1 Tax=Microscilla marina TaxID=1027 RepID=UPI0005D4712F|nr:VOC family protein [Microscilla marina]
MGLPSIRKKNAKLRHYVSWFEIPALNLLRAVGFYNFIYDIEMETTESGGYAMALFPADNGIGGAIVVGEGSIPSESGPLVYLNAGADLAPVLGRVEEAGGRIVMEKTLISKDDGYFALFIDTEGNRLALHSKS